MATRAAETAARISHLEEVTRGLDENMMAATAELATLRLQQQAPTNLALSPHAGGFNQIGAMTLKPPSIDRFTGSREEAGAFIVSMDNRLSATGNTQTFTGLEYAVGHLSGYASAWWLSYKRTHPEVTSWSALKADFEKEFRMIDEQSVLEARMLGLRQTGSFEDYVREFLTVEVRLEDQSDGFKQRCFLRQSNAYLRDRFADRDFGSVGELISASLRLQGKVDASKFSPDVQEVPVVAAMPARKAKSKSKPKLTCYRCGKPGHREAECYAKVAKAGDSTRAQQGSKKAGRPNKGRARFGKYDGSGRVNAIEAASDEESELSDDELREGNDLA